MVVVLPAPFGSEEAVGDAAGDDEVDTGERGHRAVAFGEVGRGDRGDVGGHHHRSVASRRLCGHWTTRTCKLALTPNR